MAQLNITLNQEEVLQVLSDNGGDAFRQLLEKAVNCVLRAESDEQIGAAPYERAEGRTDRRNGTRERELTTRIGTITLRVPRHRDAPFSSSLLEGYSRSEAALVAAMAEMVVCGVSTAKVARVMEQICGKGFSKQTVSEACKGLDAAVEQFRTRPLEQGAYLFAMADATYVKVRESHRIVSKAIMVAIALRRDGKKEVIGVSEADSETVETWRGFLESLRGRGLGGLSMFTSDAHPGLVSAVQEVFPEVPWQRCQAHFARNIADAAPKGLRPGLRSELAEMFNCPDLASARKRRDEILADYGERAPKAMEILDGGFDDAMTVMSLPGEMRRCTRTSNYIERLNREIKRRSKVVGIFPGASSALRLIGALLMEENDRWAAQGRLYYGPSCGELEQRSAELIEIARLQRELRKAA